MSSNPANENVTKVTPVRIVERVEPSLAFWCDGLGYEKQVVVPHGDRIGFALLVSAHPGELMLQSRASLADDAPEAAKLNPEITLFVEVKSLGEARKCANAKVLVEERETPYGTRETVVLDPSGMVVIFAEKR